MAWLPGTRSAEGLPEQEQAEHQQQAVLATLLLTTTASGLGLSARWQLKPVYWLMVVSLCILITNTPLGLDPAPSAVVVLASALLASGGLATLLQAW